MSTSIKHRISITALAAFMGLACSAITLPVLAIADGQHNDKTCYAETAGGIEMSSPCSSRGTSCNDDFTCSINGVAGNMGDGLEMNKADIIADISDEPTDTSTNTGANKATDYNSSRSNKADVDAAPDSDASTGTTDVYIKIPPIKGETAKSKGTTARMLGKAHSDSEITPGNGPELVELGQPTYDKTKNAKPAKAKSYIKIDDIKGNAGRRGNAVVEDITVVKELDKSSIDEVCNAVGDDCDDDGVE